MALSRAACFVAELDLYRHPPAVRAGPGQYLAAGDVMTAAEVAVLLGVPPSTVHLRARQGTLPSRKLGKRRIFIRQKIEALLLDDTVA